MCSHPARKEAAAVLPQTLAGTLTPHALQLLERSLLVTVTAVHDRIHHLVIEAELG